MTRLRSGNTTPKKVGKIIESRKGVAVLFPSEVSDGSLLGLTGLHMLHMLELHHADGSFTQMAESGREYSLGEASRRGGRPPPWPPLTLIWSVSLVDLLVFLLILLVNLLIFWDWIACKLIT